MYDLIDRPVTDLPSFERGVLVGMRRWVHALTLAGTAPTVEREDGLAVAMTVLDAGSVETLVIQRPCHPTVAETEAVILGLWRLVRADRLVTARAAAAHLVTADHAPRLIGAMTRTVAAHP